MPQKYETAPIIRRTRIPETVQLVAGMYSGVYDNATYVRLPRLGDYLRSNIAKLSDTFVTRMKCGLSRAVHDVGPNVAFAAPQDALASPGFLRMYFDDTNTSFADYPLFNCTNYERATADWGGPWNTDPSCFFTELVDGISAPIFALEFLCPQSAVQVPYADPARGKAMLTVCCL